MLFHTKEQRHKEVVQVAQPVRIFAVLKEASKVCLRRDAFVS